LGAPEDDAEDVVQEVLLAIHLKRGTWDQTRPIGPWLAAITRNKFIDVLRKRGRHISVPIEHVADSLAAGYLTTQPRAIVRSISLNGDGIRETAQRRKMTEGAVRVALHRGLKLLGAFYRGQRP
jgi:RNA polymerase sigma-70 factor (ECF subfamily)